MMSSTEKSEGDEFLGLLRSIITSALNVGSLEFGVGWASPNEKLVDGR